MLVVPTVVCVLNIHVYDTESCLYCEIRSQQRGRKPNYNHTALVERNGVVWVPLRA